MRPATTQTLRSAPVVQVMTPAHGVVALSD